MQTPRSVVQIERRPRRTGRPAARPAAAPPTILPRRVTEDARALATALRRTIEGEVRFGDGDRGLYADDGSNYRFPPIGVVVPRSVDDVVATIAACREFDAAVTPRGGGTALAGQTVNATVIIDFSKYLHRRVDIDGERRRARVEPGVVLDVLRNAANRHGLTFGPDPATHAWCTLGGMIANNSCGVHSLQSEFYGPGARTSDNLAELEILTYRGHRFRVGATSAE